MPSSGRFVQSTSESNVTFSGPPHFGSKETSHAPVSSDCCVNGVSLAAAVPDAILGNRFAEHHEHRPARIKFQRHGRATIFLRERDGITDFTGHRIPQFRLAARNAEG